jgi:hypothetical protein
MAVLAVGALVTVRAIGDSARLHRTSDETAMAERAARSVVERMYGARFDEVFRRWNATTADDPALGASPGAGFAVGGLQPDTGDADGLPGAIRFPAVEASPGRLSEVADGFPGAPLDLNLDGDAVDTDVTAGHRALPVRVTVTWRGQAGTGRYEVATILSEQP